MRVHSPAPTGPLEVLLAEQDGVVGRAQALAAGLAPHDLERLLRRRELARVCAGVYVEHTGPLTFEQRCWAAVLRCAPAVLAGPSVLRLVEGPTGRRADGPVHVAVAADRRLGPYPGLVVTRRTGLDLLAEWHRRPPRLRYDEAVIDVAGAATSDLDAVGELARAVQSRRTTADRLAETAAARSRLPRRRWLDEVLRDVAQGTCSVLEHSYLTRVERAHGLDASRRQVRDRVGRGVVYRDVLHRCGVVVELDGRLFHDDPWQRDRDLDRDLDTAAGGVRTVRLGWGQVHDRPCATAARLAAVLRRAGWTGAARRCRAGCPVGPTGG